MAEVIYDKSKASSQSTVKLEDGRFVRAENVVAVAGEGGGGSGGPTTAAQVSMNPQENVNANNVQAAMEIISQNFGTLENQVSVLTTATDLSTEIGEKTTLPLSALTAMDIDGRPSHKQAGATVYSDNGVVGIVDSVNSTEAIITTVSTSASVSKGHTWTILESDGNQQTHNASTASIVINLGNLPDGHYEVLVKQQTIGFDNKSAWRLLFERKSGQAEYNSGTKFVPAPELAPTSTYSAWAGKNLTGNPILISGLEDLIVAGYAGYPDETPGTVNIWAGKARFEVSDILNLDTGEYINLKSLGIEYGDATLNLGLNHNYWGANPYYTEVYVNDYSTGGSGPSEVAPVYGFQIAQAFEFAQQNSSEYLSYGHAPKSIFYLYIALSDMSSSTILKLQLFMGEFTVEAIKATGIFTNTIWDCRVGSRSDIYLYPNNTITIPDGLSLRSGFCYSGNGGSYCYIQYLTDDNRPHYTPDLQLTALPRQVPTASSSAYTLYHENGLIEMGNIVPITDTLQPGVAFGNIPVVFSQELANANFVPTITVMTDGTFKQVMADVANPTATGFDLCVRNVDTEAASGIKIAWKVVGTKK